MKPILALNAFDMNDAAGLGGALEERVRQRAKLFGAASVLFYDRPLEFGRRCVSPPFTPTISSRCWMTC
jgi:hypothetical protein